MIGVVPQSAACSFVHSPKLFLSFLTFWGLQPFMALKLMTYFVLMCCAVKKLANYTHSLTHLK